jgi:hypothetical protein
VFDGESSISKMRETHDNAEARKEELPCVIWRAAAVFAFFQLIRCTTMRLKRHELMVQMWYPCCLLEHGYIKYKVDPRACPLTSDNTTIIRQSMLTRKEEAGRYPP